MPTTRAEKEKNLNILLDTLTHMIMLKANCESELAALTHTSPTCPLVQYDRARMAELGHKLERLGNVEKDFRNLIIACAHVQIQ